MPFSAYDVFAYLSSGSLIVAAIDVLHGQGWILKKDHPLALDVFLVLAAYIMGHIVAHVSATIFENGLVRRGLLAPSYVLLGKTRSGFPSVFWNYHKPLHEETKKRLLAAVHARGFSGSGEALFVHVFGVLKGDAATMARCDSFRNLYGFARNISLSLLVVGVLILVGPSGDGPQIPYGFAWAAFALSLLMLLRYLKFLRLYTHELFVTYAELPLAQENKT